MENTVRLKLPFAHTNTTDSGIGGKAYALAGTNEVALLLKETSYLISSHRNASSRSLWVSPMTVATAPHPTSCPAK
jgi:hypothetical protein